MCSYDIRKKRDFIRRSLPDVKAISSKFKSVLPYHRSYHTSSIDGSMECLWEILPRIFIPNKIIILGTNAASRGRNSNGRHFNAFILVRSKGNC